MQGPFLRKYGLATTVDFVLFTTDGASLKTDAVHASGDTTIMKDEGAEANTASGFVDEGRGYSIALAAAEMQAARVVVYVVDQTSPKVWLDTAIVVETYGHASAQHAVDLDDSVRAGLTALPNAAADAAGGLPISDAGGLDLDAILADTSELQTDLADGGRLDLLVDAIKAKTDNLPADPADDSDIDAQLADIAAAVAAIAPAAIADAVCDEALSGHTTAGTVGKALADAAAELGAGAIAFTYTLTSAVDGSPITDADVWVTSDQAGNDVLASGETDSNGQVTFWLDAGTVYVWRQKPGWNFTNPDTEVVA